MGSTKRNRRRARREQQVDPGEEEDTEVAFRPETEDTEVAEGGYRRRTPKEDTEDTVELNEMGHGKSIFTIWHSMNQKL